MNLFRKLSSWGSGNYRPSAPFLYDVASHVKNCHSGRYYYYYYYYYYTRWFATFPFLNLLAWIGMWILTGSRTCFLELCCPLPPSNERFILVLFVPLSQLVSYMFICLQVEQFSYAWRHHALKMADDDNPLTRKRKGTLARESHVGMKSL